MKALRLLTLMAACCAAGTMSNVAFGAETAPAKPGATAATPATPVPDKPAAGESAAPKTDEQSSAAQQPSAAQEDTQAQIDAEAREQAKEQAKTAKPKNGKGTPDRFTPSEQVRADFDVSFPIDI